MFLVLIPHVLRKPLVLNKSPSRSPIHRFSHIHTCMHTHSIHNMLTYTKTHKHTHIWTPHTQRHPHLTTYKHIDTHTNTHRQAHTHTHTETGTYRETLKHTDAHRHSQTHPRTCTYYTDTRMQIHRAMPTRRHLVGVVFHGETSFPASLRVPLPPQFAWALFYPTLHCHITSGRGYVCLRSLSPRRWLAHSRWGWCLFYLSLGAQT